MDEKSICTKCGKNKQVSQEYCEKCIIDMEIRKIEEQLEV